MALRKLPWACRDKIIVLIDLYKKNPCLWDTTNYFYRREDLKNKIWNEIANEMAMDVEEVKIKVKTLRKIYTVEKRKLEEQKFEQGTEHCYKSSFLWFEEMKFLDPLITSGTTTCDIEEKEDCNDDREPNPRIKRNCNLKSFNETDNRSFEEKDVQTPKIPVVEEQNDDFQIFGDYVASEFRALKSEENRRLLRLKIQRAILEVADIDNQAASVLSSEMVYEITPLTTIQVKEEEM